MTREIVFGPQAAEDLESLYRFIAAERPGNAVSFIRRIRDRCGLLADFPLAGRARDDLRPGLRLLAFERRVVIAYAVRSNDIDILRILYGGRDIDAILDESDPDEGAPN